MLFFAVPEVPYQMRHFFFYTGYHPCFPSKREGRQMPDNTQIGRTVVRPMQYSIDEEYLLLNSENVLRFCEGIARIVIVVVCEACLSSYAEVG